MDFWGALGVLRRRWFVAAPAAVLAVLIAFGTFLSIPTTYQSTGVLVLTSPALGGTFTESTNPEDAQRINPFLAFDSSLTTAAQILVQIVRDPATAEELGVGPDSTDTFDVNNGSAEQRGPFVVVVATSEDEEGSRALVGRVLDRIVKELDDRQKALDAPPSTFITSQMLVRPTQPDPQIGGKVRFAGAALLLTMFLAFAAPFAVESIASRRRPGTDAEDNADEGFRPQDDVDRTEPHAAVRPAAARSTVQEESSPRPKPRPRVPVATGIGGGELFDPDRVATPAGAGAAQRNNGRADPTRGPMPATDDRNN